MLQAERDHGAFSQALRRWLGSAGPPSFRNVSISPPPAASPTPTRRGERGSGSESSEGTSHFHRQEMVSGWQAQVAGVSQSLPRAKLRCFAPGLVIHHLSTERLLFAEH